MKQKARTMDVDLLLIDTGDLHDGAGLSDATADLPNGVNGQVSNPIFENIDYDILTIGNHELYVSEISYETFSQFSKVYGDRYLTSNVQIYNPSSGAYEVRPLISVDIHASVDSYSTLGRLIATLPRRKVCHKR